VTCGPLVCSPLPLCVDHNSLSDVPKGGPKQLLQESKEEALACTSLTDKDGQHLKGNSGINEQMGGVEKRSVSRSAAEGASIVASKTSLGALCLTASQDWLVVL
jgi:hypothetical protein